MLYCIENTSSKGRPKTGAKMKPQESSQSSSSKFEKAFLSIDMGTAATGAGTRVLCRRIIVTGGKIALTSRESTFYTLCLFLIMGRSR